MGRFGSARFEPDTLTCGTHDTFKLIYTVGSREIENGGGIKVGVLQRNNFPRVQISDPKRPNYVTTTTTETGAAVRINPHRMRVDFEYVEVTAEVTEGKLVEGDQIIITYGDTSGGSPGATIAAMSHSQRVTVFIDYDGSRNYVKMPDPPKLVFVPDEAVKLVALTPSRRKPGERFYVHVKAVDKHGNPAEGYRGRIRFEGDAEGLPEPYEFTEADGGVHMFADAASFNEPGFHTLDIVDDENGLGATTDLVEIIEDAPLNIYWGEIHGQTLMSDGLTIPDKHYRYGRDVEALDVCATSDHDTHMSRREIGGADEYIVSPFWKHETDAWAVLKYEADRFNEPGKFVTFLGYEWTSGHCFTPFGMGFGHKNVYYLSDDEPMYSHTDKEADTPAKLYNLLRLKEAIVIPHHSSRPVNPEDNERAAKLGRQTVAGNDWRYHDSEKERLVEIYSHWGTSEYHGNPRPVIDCEPGGYVQEGLAAGVRVGFTGGSDSHCTRPGANVGKYRSGITAFLAESLTRESIFDAMMARHTYATTGERIFLEVWLNEHMMGEEFEIEDPSTPKVIRVRVAGTAPLEKVEVVKNNENVHCQRPDGKVCEFEWVDESETSGGDYYYVRVTQTDTEMAWSSPIWIDVADER